MKNIYCKDNVNHPSHYNSENGLEVIDIIDSFTKGLNDFESFYVGNILKYVCRFKKKNGVEDLKKASWYLNRLINKTEAKYDENEQKTSWKTEKGSLNTYK